MKNKLAQLIVEQREELGRMNLSGVEDMIDYNSYTLEDYQDFKDKDTTAL